MRYPRVFNISISNPDRLLPPLANKFAQTRQLRHTSTLTRSAWEGGKGRFGWGGEGEHLKTNAAKLQKPIEIIFYIRCKSLRTQESIKMKLQHSQ